jgi:hypothetical protein
MIFKFDQYIDNKPYPNTAIHVARPHTAEWRQFSQHWPFSEPPSLIDYFNNESISWTNGDTECYIIAVSFFDFSINWFELIPAKRKKEIQQGQLYLVFYYSEGDNPFHLRQHLEKQCVENNVPTCQLLLISANSFADQLPNSAWFADDELLFRLRNRGIMPLPYHEHPRTNLFTALVRTHKWWRATTMAELWRQGWHSQGLFSYNPTIAVGEPEEENPIQVDLIPGLRTDTYKFLKHQFTADHQTSDQHNNHHLCVPAHFQDSYLNIVIETHMDVDQSGGVFITEKTFKPIKHAQPFIIFGAAHTLAKLQDLGYKTFNGVIDNSYDHIEDTTQRWMKLISILNNMFSKGPDYMHKMYCACKSDLLHNQQIFLRSKKNRLNTLIEKILCK